MVEGKTALTITSQSTPPDTQDVNDKKDNCQDFILKRAKELNRAFCYRDLGNAYKSGTFRNNIATLRKLDRILKLPKENPARFILAEWASRPEYSFLRRNDKQGVVVKWDLLSFLEGLNWAPVLAVHELRLRFSVFSIHRLVSIGTWKYHKKTRSFSHHFALSFPVTVQCFNTGTVMVSVSCSARPFCLDLDGLLALSNLLGEVRACLADLCVPEPSYWVMVQWHLNRDGGPIDFGGLGFSVTFKDFFDNVARFYYKRKLKRIRAECGENPNQTFRDLFEKILNRSEVS